MPPRAFYPIKLDSRVGSVELAEVGPLSLCAECNAPARGKGKDRYCPINADHMLRAVVEDGLASDVEVTGNGAQGIVRIGIEVKRIDEFFAALESGRLVDVQLTRMFATYPISVLAVYGETRVSPQGFFELRPPRGKWRPVIHGRNTTEGALRRFLWGPGALESGLRTYVSDSQESIAVWVWDMATTWGLPYDEHSSLRTFYREPVPPSADIFGENPATKRIARFLAGLPGIRYNRGVAAAHHFRSILAAINAPAEEWAELLVNNRRVGIQAGRAIASFVRQTIKSTDRAEK